MVSLCRVEDLPSSSSTTFRKLLESSEGGFRGDQTYFSIADDESEMNEMKPAEELILSRESCTTPTAKEHRIPEMLTCPPAPKKRKDSSVSKLNSVTVRVKKDYFVPPPNFETTFAITGGGKVRT